MKILFIISDLWENSVERQLAEIIQEILYNEAETEILDSLDGSELTIKSLQSADAIWFVIHKQNSDSLNPFFAFVGKVANAIGGKPCTFSSIGGNDGGEKTLQTFYGYLQKLNVNVICNEVACIPLNTERFECPKKYQWDLFWQKEAFLKFCKGGDATADRELSIKAIAKNYVDLSIFAIKKLKLKNVHKLIGQVVDGCLAVYALASFPVELNFEQFATSDYPKMQELLLESESLESDLFMEDNSEEFRIKILKQIIKQIESVDL